MSLRGSDSDRSNPQHDEEIAYPCGAHVVGLKPSSQRHVHSKRISCRLGAKRASVCDEVEEPKFLLKMRRLLRFARNDMENLC